MNALGLLVLNDLDNIIASLFLFVGTFSDKNIEVNMLTPIDHFYAKNFSGFHILLVIAYCLGFLDMYQISHPPTFIEAIQYTSLIGSIVFITVWYFICYSTACASCIKKNINDDKNHVSSEVDYDNNKIELSETTSKNRSARKNR